MHEIARLLLAAIFSSCHARSASAGCWLRLIEDEQARRRLDGAMVRVPLPRRRRRADVRLTPACSAPLLCTLARPAALHAGPAPQPGAPRLCRRIHTAARDVGERTFGYSALTFRMYTICRVTRTASAVSFRESSIACSTRTS
eukprot:5777346-Pleurochrysis_carterae.AAC.1